MANEKKDQHRGEGTGQWEAFPEKLSLEIKPPPPDSSSPLDNGFDLNQDDIEALFEN